MDNFIIILVSAGEWWRSDIQNVLSEFLASGGDPNISDAFLINGQPGDLYPCSTQGLPLPFFFHFNKIGIYNNYKGKS